MLGQVPDFDYAQLAPVAVVLGAMGAFLKLIFDHLRRESEKHDEEMKAQRKDFTRFLGNHMSRNTRAMSELTRTTTKLADHVEAQTKEMKALREEVRSGR